MAVKKQTKKETDKNKITKVASKVTSANLKAGKPEVEKEKEASMMREPKYEDSMGNDFMLDDNDIVPDDEIDEISIETKKKDISQTGYNKLLDELGELEDVALPAVNDRIKEAREFGDLSENAEYQSAINEKQMLETRISELKEIIANSVVVELSKKGNTVQYGSTVVLDVPERNETLTLTIIGSAEISYEHDVTHISFDSPIGMAIEGKKVGDVCKVRAERGRYDIKIVSIN